MMDSGVGGIIFLSKLPHRTLRRERALGLLGLAAELLHRSLVLGDVAAGLLLVELDQVLHHPLVKVLAAEVGVAVGREDLEDPVIDVEERDLN